MSFGSMRFYWLQSLGIAIGSAIALYTNSSIAQITPDRTLPNTSNVRLEGNTRIISGGTTRGANLFHSFSEFSVPSGSTALFSNALNIQNIISRVTGQSASVINGLITSNSTANLFLINPNGIIFGKDASLNIGGSFVATTANAIGFGNFGFFSASNPEAPAPLLTVNPNALLFNQIAASPIQNSSTAPAGLRVPDGHSLLLVGGNVNMDGGQLNADGGRIELGGLAGTGRVGLNIDTTGNLLNLSFPSQVQRADVSLTNQAQVNVTAAGGGSIAVNARNLDILGTSSLNAGISNNLGSVGTNAGNITIDATGTINLRESSVIQNIVNSGATGNAGKINIVADSLNLLTGSQLFSSTLGKGNGGEVNVRAGNTVSFDSAGNNTSTTGIISSVANTGEGKAGDINITSGSFSIINGAQLNSITFGKGDAGNVNIRAESTASFDGANAGASGILSAVGTGGIGNGGDINITTGSLTISNGAQLNAITRGQGNAGNVQIIARDKVFIDGENPNSIVDPYAGVSSIFASVGVDDNGKQAIGNGGTINITTGSLLITNGGELNAITRGQGNGGNVQINARDTIAIDGERRKSTTRAASAVFASVDGNEYSGYPDLKPAVGNGGDIKITTGSLSITRGAELSTLTKGQGNAGNVIINALNTVSLDGENSNRGPSAIFSSVDANLYTTQPPAKGNGGDIKITTRSLSITRGAELSTITEGQGNAGNVTINALNTVSLDGENSNGGSSGVFSSVDANLYTKKPPAIGNGGDIKITTNSLSVTNGGGLFASTSGQGDAGNVNINALGRVSFDGVTSNGGSSGVFSNVKSGAVGNGRNIQITARELFVTNDARLSTTSAGNGAAGNIKVDANSINLNRGTLSSETIGSEGNITLHARDLLLLRGGSNITTNAMGENVTGGNININTNILVGFENSDITANSTDFRGGNVTINTKGLFDIQFRDVPSTNTSDITATGATRELSGNVQINTPDVNPSKGLVELPINLVDASSQIYNSCTPETRQFQNTFVATGRGGLPISPTEPLQDSGTLSAWVRLKTQPEDSAYTNTQPQQPAVSNTTKVAAATTPIVAATGWVMDRNGNVQLVAQVPQVNPDIPWQTPATCPVSQ
ncbi:MAG: S-layer family protein [Rhizonema sp. PD37]|nr:S-layer family protein [Rhizonema sp. PD37]